MVSPQHKHFAASSQRTQRIHPMHVRYVYLEGDGTVRGTWKNSREETGNFSNSWMVHNLPQWHLGQSVPLYVAGDSHHVGPWSRVIGKFPETKTSTRIPWVRRSFLSGLVECHAPEHGIKGSVQVTGVIFEGQMGLLACLLIYLFILRYRAYQSLMVFPLRGNSLTALHITSRKKPH